LKFVLLTGFHGASKTRAARQVAEYFTKKALRIPATTTREIREAPSRTGPRVTDLSPTEESWLAQNGSLDGSRIGLYRADTQDLERIGAGSPEQIASLYTDPAIIEENGTMETTRPPFRTAPSQVFDLAQPTTATVKLGPRSPEDQRIGEDTVQLQLTEDNHEQILETVTCQLNNWTNPGV
jgi:nucleoside-triphosphatase THEP1